MTRFAPAPTGWLHLGHVANAIYVWGLARTSGGRVLLRIEDHDTERCRPEYERGLLEDLEWLGFEPDMFPTAAFRAGSCESRQSERGPLYQSAAAGLIARGLVYACRCTRQAIAGASPSPAGLEPRYAGTCRALGLALSGDVGWRVVMEPGIEHFEDRLQGPQSQDPAAECGDVLIRDRLGNWTYQFAASVDDHVQGVDLVIRGVDLLASTGRQMRLARLLGRPQPAAFAHHPLIMKSVTQKLSKSDHDTGVRDLREAGWTPEAVVGDAAWRVGLIERPAPIGARDVGRLFGARA